MDHRVVVVGTLDAVECTTDSVLVAYDVMTARKYVRVRRLDATTRVTVPMRLEYAHALLACATCDDVLQRIYTGDASVRIPHSASPTKRSYYQQVLSDALVLYLSDYDAHVVATHAAVSIVWQGLPPWRAAVLQECLVNCSACKTIWLAAAHLSLWETGFPAKALCATQVVCVLQGAGPMKKPAGRRPAAGDPSYWTVVRYFGAMDGAWVASLLTCMLQLVRDTALDAVSVKGCCDVAVAFSSATIALRPPAGCRCVCLCVSACGVW